MTLWILAQFVYRLTFGLAAGMALVRSKEVTSGYFRNHAYVLLGLSVVGSLAAASSTAGLPKGLPIATAAVSYAAAVAWLYERRTVGQALLVAVAALALYGGLSMPPASASAATGELHAAIEFVTAGLVLGTTLAAMFLGHWYLNAPGMAIRPIEMLVWCLMAATLLRIGVCAAELAGQFSASPAYGLRSPFVWLRWIAGLAATLLLAGMTLRTLKIPNTQSATGILYVAVIMTFLGELSALLIASSGMAPAAP